MSQASELADNYGRGDGWGSQQKRTDGRLGKAYVLRDEKLMMLRLGCSWGPSDSAIHHDSDEKGNSNRKDCAAREEEKRGQHCWLLTHPPVHLYVQSKKNWSKSVVVLTSWNSTVDWTKIGRMLPTYFNPALTTMHNYFLCRFHIFGRPFKC